MPYIPPLILVTNIMSDVERPLYENFVVMLCFLTSSDDKRRRNKTARILPRTGMHPLNSTFQISDKYVRKKIWNCASAYPFPLLPSGHCLKRGARWVQPPQLPFPSHLSSLPGYLPFLRTSQLVSCYCSVCKKSCYNV